ncbi:MAG TPA: CarD family transcriptional regulator [Candidatus Omnitrophota bacterium]|nr:CarD family transcriptional regulator [Candidatus Omnitrophota bacterium]HPS20900.1 CarD family transcriptional regulator [Candidatus Omnitrophota bacterium]
MFMIGDMVMHPGHGICRIMGNKVDRAAGGEFYMLKPERSLEGNGLIMVLVGQADVAGIRRLISLDQVDEVLKIVESAPQPIQFDNNGNTEIRSRIKKGDIKSIAGLLRDLVKNDSEGFPRDTDTLVKNAKEKIVLELSYISDMPQSRTDKKITSLLKRNR